MPDCPVCHDAVSETDVLCRHCGAPINVLGLHELKSDDLSIYAQVGIEALAEALRTLSFLARDERSVTTDSRELFDAYLSAFWLRPETALILHAEASVVAALRPQLAKPWLDLGCGDGVHASLYSGFRFDPLFDCFQGLDLTRRDMFDHFDATRFRAPIVTKAEPVDLGIDIKPTAIERSTALGTFAKVLQADATKLPLEVNSVGTIYSNMIRDLGPLLPPTLKEAARVLKPGGHLLMSSMTDRWHPSLYFHSQSTRAEQAGQSDLAKRYATLDRGRSELGIEQRSLDHWKSLFAESGLELQRAIPIVASPIVKVWDVGLRPFSTALIRQAQRWREQDILQLVKPAMMSILRQLLGPIAPHINAGADHAMQIMVATKI